MTIPKAALPFHGRQALLLEAYNRHSTRDALSGKLRDETLLPNASVVAMRS